MGKWQEGYRAGAAAAALCRSSCRCGRRVGRASPCGGTQSDQSRSSGQGHRQAEQRTVGRAVAGRR